MTTGLAVARVVLASVLAVAATGLPEAPVGCPQACRVGLCSECC